MSNPGEVSRVFSAPRGPVHAVQPGRVGSGLAWCGTGQQFRHVQRDGTSAPSGTSSRPRCSAVPGTSSASSGAGDPGMRMLGEPAQGGPGPANQEDRQMIRTRRTKAREAAEAAARAAETAAAQAAAEAAHREDLERRRAAARRDAQAAFDAEGLPRYPRPVYAGSDR